MQLGHGVKRKMEACVRSPPSHEIPRMFGYLIYPIRLDRIKPIEQGRAKLLLYIQNFLGEQMDGRPEATAYSLL